MNRRSRQTVQRRQLDARLSKLSKLRVEAPPGGWIRAIACALGMSKRQLANRIGIAQPSVLDLENGEVEGTISLKTLRRAADALGCEVTYALTPRSGSLENVVKEQALFVAKKIIRQTAHTMDLEKQGL